MEQRQQRKLVLFYSHSSDPSDGILRASLARFLRPLVREMQVQEWSDQQLLPGDSVVQERKRALESATHILLLLSAEYLASDVCYQEMLEALKRQKDGKARVIPILLRPCLLPKPLGESLSCLPSNGHPVSLWQKREKALFDVALDICQILGLPLASLRRRSTNRDRLLDRVFSYWIEGVLEPSLKEGGMYLDLSLQEQPGMVTNPWSTQVQELRLVPHPFATGRSIDQIYDRAYGELLILGKPGAGKTTLFLELVRTLLERAERDERIRMPIVFNLSSWVKKRQSLREWLVEELWMKYQVPRKIGRDWIEAGQIIPLLDGLDEVRMEDTRTACVEAINDYYQSQLEQGSCSLVVCCRSEEYASLSTRVMLQHTVSIQPLTDEQIDTYLEPLGEQVKALKQALDEDAELHELARQPLMLNIFTLAFQGVLISEVPVGVTLEKAQHAIFARYVDHMLNRRESLKHWRRERVIYWLTFLAKQMQRDGQTMFSVENLQPDWLLEGGLMGYHVSIRWTVSHLVGSVLGLLVWSLIGSATGLLFGPILWSMGAFGPAVLPDMSIQPAEALGWSWKKARSGILIALLFGPLVGWVISMSSGPLPTKLVFGLPAEIALGLLAGLALVLFAGLERGVSKKKKVERHSFSPNKGIWLSCTNGLIVGLFVGLPVGLAAGLFIGPLPGLFLGLLAGLIVGLAGGLLELLKHFALRLFLRQYHQLPWALVPFLDEMAKRLLLRKVGGSYIFVHWLLQDYLASQTIPTSSSDKSSDPSQNSSPSPQ